jgi:hypothetical protein
MHNEDFIVYKRSFLDHLPSVLRPPFSFLSFLFLFIFFFFFFFSFFFSPFFPWVWCEALGVSETSRARLVFLQLQPALCLQLVREGHASQTRDHLEAAFKILGSSVMSTPKDLEKAEVGALVTEPTSYPSHNEKLEEAGGISSGAVGKPDEGHEEVEEMNSGHMEDLELQRVSLGPVPPRKHTDFLRPGPKHLSKPGLGSPLMRIRSREYSPEPAPRVDYLE